jgi:hypothetical protein
MHGLEITRNGKRTIIAGGQNMISLNAVIAVYGKLGEETQNDAPPFGNVTVMGVSEATNQNKQKMITWNDKKDMKPGDEIIIRFIEIDEATKPSEIAEIESDEDENGA